MANIVDSKIKALFKADFDKEYGYEDVLSRLDSIVEADEGNLTAEDWEILTQFDNRARAQRLATKAGEMDKIRADALPEDNPARTITDAQRGASKEHRDLSKRRIVEGKEDPLTFSPVSTSTALVKDTLGLLMGTLRNPGVLVENASDKKEVLKRGKRAAGMLDKPIEKGSDGTFRVGSSNGGMYTVRDGYCNCPDDRAPVITIKDGSLVKGCKHGILLLTVMQSRKELFTGTLPVTPTTQEVEMNVKDSVMIVGGDVLAAAATLRDKVVDGLVQEAEKIPEVMAPSFPNVMAWVQAQALIREEETEGVFLMWRPRDQDGYDPNNRKRIERSEVEAWSTRARAKGFVTQCVQVTTR